MQQKPNLTAIVLLIGLVIFHELAPSIWAQSVILTAQQLGQLLAPVALYPDSLLARITTASTNPQEILDIANWLQGNPGLKGTALTDAAEKQGFDPPFIALTNFPQVLDMMAQHVDDYAAIGQAFLAIKARSPPQFNDYGPRLTLHDRCAATHNSGWKFNKQRLRRSM